LQVAVGCICQLKRVSLLGPERLERGDARLKLPALMEAALESRLFIKADTNQRALDRDQRRTIRTGGRTLTRAASSELLSPSSPLTSSAQRLPRRLRLA